MRTYLRELRKKAKMTQDDVAKKIGILESSYCMIEKGKRQKDLNISLVRRFGEIFDVPESYIIDEEKKICNQLTNESEG